MHPVFRSLDVLGGTGDPSRLGFVVALYVAIAVVSLAIDRRALMVSALAYVLYSVATLLMSRGVLDFGFAITAFTIGGALLVLSAFWRQTRGAVLRWLPDRVKSRLAVA